MPISKSLGIPFKNTLRYTARNNNIPCLTNCIFWGQTIDSDSYNSRLVNGNEYEAISSKANSIYFNGVDSVASITYDNDVLYYLDQVIDKYSNDSINLEIWQTGDVAVTGLFQIDLDNRTLKIGFDGTNFKEHYQTHFVGKVTDGSEIITFINYTFSEGLSNKTYDNVTDEIKSLYQGLQWSFPNINNIRGELNLEGSFNL